MIIFDDYTYVDLLVNGNAPKCINRNTVLRSCARLIARGDYEFGEILDALHKYMPFEVDENTLGEYVETRTLSAPFSPHIVSFGQGDLQCINNLPRNSDKKLYLYQMFAFKYFGVKRLRIAHREFKRMAGLGVTHYPISEMHLGHGISIIREKNGFKIADYSTNKPYTYYYPKVKSGKLAFTFLYEGDSFMLPSEPFESNLPELWIKYLEANDKYK